MKNAKELDKNMDQCISDDHSEASDNEKVYKVRLNLIPVFILETVALVSLAILAYVLRFRTTFPVHIKSYNPFDPAISLPAKVNSRSSPLDIHSGIFYIVCLTGPIGVVVLGEFSAFIFSSKPRKVVRAGCIPCKMHKLTRRLVRFTGSFLFGLFCTSILTDFLKLVSGRHRPYFLDACGINITKQPSTGCPPFWIKECNSDEDAVREARLSFPSYYASVSAYSAAFTMIYIHYTFSIRSSRLLRPSLVLFIAALSLFSGCSRIAIHRNHWEDVAFGFLLGSAIAVYVSITAANLFSEFHEMKKKNCCKRLDDHQRPQPLFFRYFRIPHVSYQGRSGRSYPISERNHYDYSGMVPVNEAFQRDLHQRVEDYSKRHGQQKKHNQHQNQNQHNYIESEKSEAEG